MKRILSIILTLLILCMCMVPGAFAAGNSLTYDLSAQGSNSVTVSTGDIVTVTYAIHSDADYQVNAIQNEIKFDDSFFELVDGSIQAQVGTGKFVEKIAGPRVYMNDYNTSYRAVQTVGTFQLKVIAKSGSSKVESTECLAYDGSGEAMPISTKDLSVSIKNTSSGGGSSSGGGEDQTISVKFRLIGAEKAKQPVDLSKSDYLPKYVTWIKTTTFKVDEGAKVYDVFMKALDQAGLDQNGAEKNYVRWITAPEVLGGYELGEFDSGERSGWMYTVNGVHVDKGLTAQGLKDGDVVIWHYVNDYLYEVEDWYGGGSGNEGTWNKWLDAADVNPTSGSASGNGEDKTEETSSVIEPDVTISGGTATAAVTEKEMSATIENAIKAGDSQIKITVKETGKADTVTVVVPAASVKSMVNETTAALQIESDKGSVVVPSEALQSIHGQMDNTDLSISIASRTAVDVKDPSVNTKDAVVVEVTVGSGNKTITSFGGKSLTIYIPAGSKHVEGQSYKVIAISADGKTDTLTGKCVKVGGKLVIQVTTTHLTTFVATTDLVDAVLKFTDVAAGTYYYDAVVWALEKGITSGTSDTTFSPNASCTRAQMVTFLWRAAGSPEPSGKTNAFTDVKEDAYYLGALLWAMENGITSGTSAATFSPDATCTRGQMAAFLYRSAGSPAVSGSSIFTDVKGSDYYSGAVAWAAQEGITSGTTATTFSPNASCTRGQMVTFLYRYLAK